MARSALVPLFEIVLCAALGSSFFSVPCAAWDPAEHGRVGQALAGQDRARVLAPAGVEIADYENAGYRLRHVGEDGIRVEVSLEPLRSATPWRAPGEWSRDAGDPVRRVARTITAGASTQYEAASRILGWVARNVVYELDREASQEPLEVLERRRAYCTGVARLTVALLESAGLEAREVPGWVVSDEVRDLPAADGVPRGFHRWVEIRYDDVGWAFSDPLHSHHFVPATYLPLASETLSPDAGLEGLLLERRDGLVAVDLYPPAPPGVRARRNDARQVAASLRVVVGSPAPGLAILQGESVRLTHSLVDGATTFLGLEPGSYRLEVQVPGRPILRHEIELPDRRRGLVNLRPARRADFHTSNTPDQNAEPAPRPARAPGEEPQER